MNTANKELNENLFQMNEASVLDEVRKMKKLLSNHNGPLSKYTLIGNPFQPMSEPNFTNDGYTIFQNYHVSEVAPKFIHMMVNYLGRKVSVEIGDGTTTSMLIGLSLLEIFLDKEHPQHAKLQTLINQNSFAKLQTIVDELFACYQTILDKVKIKPSGLPSPGTDSEATTHAMIAYHQSKTSSHGDEFIAEMVGEVFRKLPFESLDSVTFMRAGAEMAERLTIIDSDYQFNCRSDVLDTKMLTEEENTKFIARCEKVYICNNPISDGTTYYPAVLNAIRHAFENGTNFALITTGACGHSRTEFLTLLNVLRAEHAAQKESEFPLPKVGIFFVETKHNYANNISVICALKNINYQPGDMYELRDVDVEFEAGVAELRLGNLYDGISERHSNIKPMFQDPQFPFYNTLYEFIEKRIELLKGSTGVDSKSTEIMELSRLRHLLLLNRRTTIMIGGGLHDNTSMVNIMEDCVNASRKSIQDGFVSGGLLTTEYILDKMISSTEIDVSSEVLTFAEVLKYIIRSLVIPSEEVMGNLRALHGSHGSYDVLTDTINSISDTEVWNSSDDRYKEHTIIIQPASFDLTLITRVKEVILRLLYTSDFLFT